MTNRLANRLLSVLRASVLALFVLGVVVQPVAASMSEIHELSHETIKHGLAEHGLDAHQSLAEHSSASTSDTVAVEDGASEALHALHHFAHCCGSFTGIMTARLDVPLPPVASRLMAVSESPARTNRLELAPFRPPITA